MDGELRLVFSSAKWRKSTKNIQNKYTPSDLAAEERVFWVNSTIMRSDVGSDYIVREESSVLCHRFEFGSNEQDLKTRIIFYQSSGW